MKAIFEKIAPQAGASFACQEFRLPVFDCPYHFHPEYELTYIAGSHGRRYVGDSIAPFEPGDLILIGANLPHMYYNNPAESRSGKWAHSYVLQFQEDCLGGSFFNLPEAAGVATLLKKAQAGLQFHGETRAAAVEKLQALPGAKGAQRLILFLDMLNGLAGSSEYVTLCSSAYAPDLNPHASERIDRVCAYVNAHLSDAVSQTEAAALVNLSPPAFSRFFRRATGKTFTRFVNEVRIGEACRQLIETGRSITDICYGCGFANLSNFNRQFRAHRGVSPREYRHQFTEAPAAVPGRFEVVETLG